MLIRLSAVRASAAALALALGALLAAPPTPAAGPGATTTRDDFCVGVQLALAGTTLMPKNTVQPDWIAFRESKPAIQPLETQQHVEYEDAARTQPRRIACKTKTWDQIVATYGAGSAREGGGANCRDMNRDTILSVWGAMSAKERARAVNPPQNIMLDGDDNRIMGSQWVEPYDFIYKGADGRVHILAKALKVAWLEWPWRLAPARFRGTYYCYLVAPEYARKLMLGEAAMPVSSVAVAATN